MFSIKSIVTALAVATVLVVSGCSKMPSDQELTTKASLDNAQKVEAETYATATWTEAQEAMKRAEAEMVTQNDKLGFMRSYGKASDMLVEAQTLAEKASTEAVAAKEAVRQETQAAFEAALSEWVATQKLLSTAPKGKDTRAEIESMQQEMLGLQTSMDGVAELVRTEQFQVAQAQLDQVRTKLAAISDDLQNAIAKVQGRK